MYKVNDDGFEAKPSWSRVSPLFCFFSSVTKEFNQSEACSHILRWQHFEHPRACPWALNTAAGQDQKHQLRTKPRAWTFPTDRAAHEYHVQAQLRTALISHWNVCDCFSGESVTEMFVTFSGESVTEMFVTVSVVNQSLKCLWLFQWWISHWNVCDCFSGESVTEMFVTVSVVNQSLKCLWLFQWWISHWNVCDCFSGVSVVDQSLKCLWLFQWWICHWNVCDCFSGGCAGLSQPLCSNRPWDSASAERLEGLRLWGIQEKNSLE